MALTDRYPSIAYLEERARQRIPHFAWEYLASGTGSEVLVSRNRAALDACHLTPGVLGGRFTPDTSKTLFGHTYAVPFGAAPVGMSGLMWPGAERIIAATAASRNMAYTLSLVASETPEAIASIAGENAWFQLYPPSTKEVQGDLLKRARDSGYRNLVVTVDVPVGSTRERQIRAGLTVPPKMTPLTLFRIAKRPAWALATLKHGQPRFRTLESYFDAKSMASGARLVGTILDGRPDWDYLACLRDEWQGNLIVKGILAPEDARRAVDTGADGIVVSNHGGRQFDAAPAAIDALPDVASEISGRVPIIFDSGIRGGLDIIRAYALGADFCLLGRAFLFAVAALGDRGADHAFDILKADLDNNMIQLGVPTLDALRPTAGAPARQTATG